MRLKEAEDSMKAGEKAKKTGFLKWKPDWLEAIGCYERAATIYRGMKMTEQTVKAYELACEACIENGQLLGAAKHYETLAVLMRDEKRIEDCIVYSRKGSDIYAQAGNYDKAAENLCKAGKVMADISLDEAYKLYCSALAIQEENERWHFTGDTYRGCFQILVKGGKLKEAVELLERQVPTLEKLNQDNSIHQNFLTIVVLKLAMRDEEAASELHQKFLSEHDYFQSGESQAGTRLLDAFENRDIEEVERAAKDRCITYLDNEVAKLARKLGAVANDMSNDLC